jgi:hypothetical protein
MAKELDGDRSDGHQMTTQRREGLVKKSRQHACLRRLNALKRLSLLAIKAILSPSRPRDEKGGGIAEKGQVAEAP